MTRSTNRRAARPLVAALAAGTAALLAAGCSAGQIAETARKNPSVQGVNATAEIRDDSGALIGSVAVRDVAIAYDSAGYEAGGGAPLNVLIFNDTPEAVTVRVAPAEPEVASEQTVTVNTVVLAGPTPTAVPEPLEPEDPDARKSPGATTTPDDSEASPAGSPAAEPAATAEPSPTAQPGRPASFEIPAGGYVAVTADGASRLMLNGLATALRPGMSVPVLFTFSNGAELRVTAPMAPPLTAPARATPVTGEHEAGH